MKSIALSLLWLGVILASKTFAESPRKFQVLPLVDSEGKENGCVYHYDGRCYSTLDVLQSKLIESYEKSGQTKGAPQISDLIRFKNGQPEVLKIYSYDGKLFASQSDLVEYLAFELSKQNRGVETPTVSSLKLDTMILKLHVKNPDQSPFVVLTLDWDEIEKNVPIAQKRVIELSEKYKDAAKPSTIDPTKEIYIYDGLLRGFWPEHAGTGHTPGIRLVGDFSKKIKHLIINVAAENGRDSSSNGIAAYEVTDLSKTYEIKLSSESEVRVNGYYQLTVGDLQKALGKNAQIIGVAKSLEEAEKIFLKK